MPLRSEATFVYRPFDLIGVNQRAARDSRAALCRMHVYIGARQSLIKGLLISWYPFSQYTGTRYNKGLLIFCHFSSCHGHAVGEPRHAVGACLGRFGQQKPVEIWSAESRSLPFPPRHHPLHTHISPLLPATRPLLICHRRPLSPSLP